MTGTPRVITLPTTTTSGRGVSWRGVEPRGELDAERLELRAHGWIDVLVRTRDAMARGLGDGGDAAHERAADAENVNVHGRNLEPLGRCRAELQTAARRCRRRAKFRREDEDDGGEVRPLERGAHDAHLHDEQPDARSRAASRLSAAGGGIAGSGFSR